MPQAASRLPHLAFIPPLQTNRRRSDHKWQFGLGAGEARASCTQLGGVELPLSWHATPHHKPGPAGTDLWIHNQQRPPLLLGIVLHRTGGDPCLVQLLLNIEVISSRRGDSVQQRSASCSTPLLPRLAQQPTHAHPSPPPATHLQLLQPLTSNCTTAHMSACTLFFWDAVLQQPGPIPTHLLLLQPVMLGHSSRPIRM